MAQPNAEGLPFHTIGIVGCGLIGCSIAAALKNGRFAGRIVGCGRPGKNLETAVEGGLIDGAETDLTKAAATCDLIVICTPVDRIVEDVRAAARKARAGTLITDAGSAKQAICGSIGTLPAGITFIGSHPIAGSEKQGCIHAEADLFEARVCVLTPLAGTPRAELVRLAEFWQALGMSVVEMSPEAHDRALAQTSHVPHVVAAALAASLAPENRGLTAGGFQDTTRIAAGDPALWTAILLANADQISAGLRAFSARLDAFLSALESHDQGQLTTLLTTAKHNRDGLGTNSGEEARGDQPKGPG